MPTLSQCVTPTPSSASTEPPSSPSSSAGQAESWWGVSTVRGADWVIGSGRCSLNYDGRNIAKRGLMGGYRKRGFAGIVWEHTVQTFERVVPGVNGVDSA
ncbi:hypothetical protein BJX65DRAFT_306268 [Aspergillus insuetus]